MAPPDDPQAPPEGEPGNAPQKPNDRNGPFTPETPFSTRFFVLRFQDDGTLLEVDLDKIASVTEADTASYLAAALAHGAGYGYCGH